MEYLLKKSIKITLVLIVLISVVLFVMQKRRWACGFVVGNVWSIVNFLLLINLLKIAMLQLSKAKLLLILLIKFPVLYLAGLLILISRFFPVSSLLAGLSLILLVSGAVNICQKRT